MDKDMQANIFTYIPPKQTLKAWEPFWDCVGILFQFQHSEIDDCGEELPEWRIIWIAGVTLLRVIGHVLHKVDAQKSASHLQAINGTWNWIKSQEIFSEFIEKERNSVLKTYTSGARFVTDEDGCYIDFNDEDDAFHLYREAVYWWRNILIDLEDELSS